MHKRIDLACYARQRTKRFQDQILLMRWNWVDHPNVLNLMAGAKRFEPGW